MSDETPKPRNDTDPAARVANELRARLRSMAPEQLVDLAAELLTTYVVEGVLPLARAGEGAPDLAADTTGDESFPQLLKRLKTTKKDPTLERFIIDGENITVRIDGYGMLPLTEYRRPTAPPLAPGSTAQAPPRRESVPGASTSIYNRGLYQNPEAPPSSAAPAPAPARGAPPASANPAQGPGFPKSAPAPAQKPGAPGQPGKKDEPKSDRFNLIELE